jgi:hypothetical protein
MRADCPGYKEIDQNGHYWILRSEKCFDFHTPNQLKVHVIEGYNLTERFQKQLTKGKCRDPLAKSTLPFDEKVAALCQKWQTHRYEDEKDCKTGKFGIIRTYYDWYGVDAFGQIIGNPKLQIRRIDVPPAFDSWKHVKEGEIEGIGLFNKSDFENTFHLYTFGNWELIKM